MLRGEKKQIGSLATILKMQHFEQRKKSKGKKKKKKLPQGKRAGVRGITCALKKSSL